MTTTTAPGTPTPADPEGVVLDLDEAADLARLLELIDDGLRHADHDARADLAAISTAPAPAASPRPG